MNLCRVHSTEERERERERRDFLWNCIDILVNGARLRSRDSLETVECAV